MAATPADRAANATAWAWLPAEGAITPAARCASVSERSLVYAPRILNDPVLCWFSCLRNTSHPAHWENVSDRYTGVRWATPCRFSAASRMSSRGIMRTAKAIWSRYAGALSK